jgi:hypothetical protein
MTLASSAILVGTLSAQLDRGSLAGIVSDPSGASVANAQIKATHLDTNTTFSTLSSESGNYTLPALAIGRYRILVEAPGFRRTQRDDVAVTSGESLRSDFTLELGAVTDSVQVTSQASVIQTESTRVSTNLTTKLVEDLPLVVAGQVRNVFNLAVIAPEAKNSSTFRIGGGQGSGWDMQMDGASLTSGTLTYQYERAPISSVPVDAIAEFNVESSGMKAEYGRAMGVVSFATKAGGNNLHGNAFDYMRNNAADARGFFAQSAPVLKQHDFGFTLGGPVYIPKIYNGKNRTFFFGSYEGFRNRSGNLPAYFTVPLPEMYTGDFRNFIKNGADGKPFMIQLYDPATTTLSGGSTYTRLPFANNQIPVSRFSSVASKYMGFRDPSMLPNVPGAGIVSNYFRSQGTNISPWDKFSIRVDHQVNTRNHFSFLLMDGTKLDQFGADGPPGLPGIFNSGQVWSRKNISGRFSWDRTISNRIINSLRVMVQKEEGRITNLSCVESGKGWAAKLGLKNTPGPDQCFPGWSFSNITAWSGNGWGYDRGRNLSISDDVTWTKGSHTLKAGLFYSKDDWWGGGQHRPNGSFNFGSGATSIPGDSSGNSGNGFAAFLLGLADSWGLETPRAVIQKYKYYGGFFQDDWRISSRLTVNLGLRYEYTTPVGGGAVLGVKDWSDFSSYGTAVGFMNFDPTVPNPQFGGILGSTVYTGNCSECTGKDAFNSYKKAFSPRLGLAYQVASGTVIRMYGGKSYGAVKTTGGSTHFQGLILNSTYSAASSLPAYTYWNIDEGLPAWTQPPFRGPATDAGGSTYLWQNPDSGRPPEFYSWNIDIQKQLPKNVVASIGYTGTKGTHLSSAILQLNQMDPKYFKQYGRDLLNSAATSPAAVSAGIKLPYAGFTGTVSQALRPFPHYGAVETNNSSVGERSGDSTYNAMIVKLDKRYSSGLTLLSSYVLSKMLSNSENAQSVGRDATFQVDHYNRKLGKGLSTDDQTHMLRQAFTYELPVGKGRHWALKGPADKIVGGWGVAGFLEYSSGTPLVVAPGVSSIPGGAGNRVFINSYDNWRAPISGSKFDPFKDVWWNKSAFGLDANGRQMTSAELLLAGIGNASKNNPHARSPWLLNENITLSKSFEVTEKVRFTLRVEAFNLFNRVRMGGPDSTVTSANFGLIRSQGNDPRRLQFAAKITF